VAYCPKCKAEVGTQAKLGASRGLTIQCVQCRTDLSDRLELANEQVQPPSKPAPKPKAQPKRTQSPASDDISIPKPGETVRAAKKELATLRRDLKRLRKQLAAAEKAELELSRLVAAAGGTKRSRSHLRQAV
jgi:hypothetical protein